MTGDRKTGFNFIRWSVENPHAVIAFYIAMMLLGVGAIGFYMPKRLMPYIESPLLAVTTMMPGMSAEEMETYFSAPIEQRMTIIPNVRYIRSVSQDGFSLVTLEFPYGTNMDKMLTQVQSLLNIIQSDLPETGANLKPSWILKVDPLNLPVLTLSLTAEEGSGWDLAELREFADNTVVNRLKARGTDVFAVTPFGGYRRQLQVDVDRDKLAAVGLSLLDVRDAIDMYNVAMPAGRLTAATEEWSLRVDTLGRTAQKVAQYPIKTVGDQVVRVGDVARVSDTVIEHRSAYRHLHGETVKDAIAIEVLQNPDASSPVVIASVKKELAQLEEDFPGVKFAIAYNNASFVDILFANMYHELILAILLTGLAVLFFLGEWRGTVIALTAIPVSMAMALIGLIPLGMSLNSSTLIGLLLAIGRLVDDAIIDVHSVERHLRMGKDRKTAVIDGITEVRRSVFAATAVLILALTPLLLSGGIVELMFVGLVWPIIFGLAASFLVSMTLTSVMCSMMMRLPEERGRNWFSRLLLDPFQRFLDWLEVKYEHAIAYVIRHRFVVLSAAAVTIILGFTFYYFIGSEMMPLADVGSGSFQLEMKPGTSFAETKRAVEKFEKIMIEEGGKQGWIKDVGIAIGTEGGPGMPQDPFFTGYAMRFVNGASGMITFSDKDSGRPDIWTIMDMIHDRSTKEIPGIRRLSIKEMGADVMATSLAPVALVVYGKDLGMLSRMAEEVVRIGREEVVMPGTGRHDLTQAFSTWSMSQPILDIQVDEEKAAQNGLSPHSIAEQAYYALQGGYTRQFFRIDDKRLTTLRVRYQEDERREPTDLTGMYVTGMDGTEVPLLDVVTVRERMGPSLIEHDNLRRVVSVGGYYRKDGRPSMDLTMDWQMRAHAELNWPPGYGIDARGDMTQMMGSFRVLLYGLGIAMLFVFLILVAQFRGFLQPLQMLLSLPLEMSGVFLMLWLMHQAFSTVSIMAVIVVSGMDITAAILLIDLIIRYREEGVPRNVAVVKACPQRLRPILMTAIITIIVMIPVAFFPRTGIDAYQPLGSVVVGGLTVGTFLSLLVIPVMHTVVDDIQRWIHVRVLRRDPALLDPIEEDKNA